MKNRVLYIVASLLLVVVLIYQFGGLIRTYASNQGRGSDVPKQVYSGDGFQLSQPFGGQTAVPAAGGSGSGAASGTGGSGTGASGTGGAGGTGTGGSGGGNVQAPPTSALPSDERINPATGDRFAVYFNTKEAPGRFVFYGINPSNSQGYLIGVLDPTTFQVGRTIETNFGPDRGTVGVYNIGDGSCLMWVSGGPFFDATKFGVKVIPCPTAPKK